MGLKLHLLSAKLRPDPIDERDYKFTSISDVNRMVKVADALPSKYSWRSEMSSVKYQGAYGACTAFAVCALKEWQEQKEHKVDVKNGIVNERREKEYNLSEQWVYWNAKKIDPWPDEQGTNFRSALKVVQKIGVPLEASWPYSDDPLDIGEPQKWAHLIAKWSTIDSYWRVGDSAENIKRALMESPILLGMKCFEEMYGIMKDGKIPYPAKPNEIWSYHAVLAVGFNNETQEICIKNSWSKFFGDSGYGHLPYQYVDDHCWDAWMAKDISVTPEMLTNIDKLIK